MLRKMRRLFAGEMVGFDFLTERGVVFISSTTT